MDLTENQSKDVIDVARRVLLKELSSELSWRLALYGLFSASVTFAAVILSGRKDAEIAIMWLSLAVLALILHSVLLRVKTVHHIFRIAVVIASVNFIWWMILPLFLLSPDHFNNFVFCILIFTIGTLTLPGQAILPIYAALITVSYFFVLRGEQPLIWAVAICLVLLASLRSSLTHYSRFMTRISIAVFSRLLQRTSSMDILSLVWWMLGHILSVRGIVLIQGKTVYRSDGDELLKDDGSAVGAQALLQFVKESQSSAGVVPVKNLEKEAHAFLKDYFPFIPYHCVFFRLSLLHQEQEQEVYVFAPVNIWLYFGNIHKIIRDLYTFTTLVQFSFNAEKERLISSSKFLDVERKQEHYGSQLRDIVHRVNNISQGMHVQIDKLRGSLDSEDEWVAEGAVNALEDNVQRLTYELSDLQLIRELLKLRSLDSRDTLLYGSLRDSCVEWARLLGSELEIEESTKNEDMSAMGISVVSSSYLEALIRTYLRIDTRGMETKRIEFTTIRREANCYLRLGFAVDRHIFKNRIEDLKQLKSALIKFAELSLGAFDSEHHSFSSSPADDVFWLELLLTELKPEGATSAGGWILLVDDNRDVLNFYASVAQALNVRSSGATSLKDARECLKSMGMPRLLITDIQVEDGSGLELVAECRERFGREFPIIVVSGVSEQERPEAEKNLHVQASLMKPVSRRKLFEVVQQSI